MSLASLRSGQAYSETGMINNAQEINRYRDLWLNLTRKELKVKYRNSALGFLWSLLNPILMMLVFAFVFSFVFKFELARGMFVFHLLPALLLWNFFSQSVELSAGGIVGNAALVRKIYFPRAVLPLSVVSANLFGYIIELAVLVVFLAIFEVLGLFPYPFYLYLLLLVILVPALVAFVVGFSLMVASFNVYYRDVEHLISILLMVWFYASPIIYPFEFVRKAAVEKGWTWLPFVYKLNPIASMVICFRDIFYWTRLPSPMLMAYSVLMGLGMLLVGFWLFTRYEPYFAEEV